MKWAIGIVLVLLVLTQYELHALNAGFSVLIHSRMEDTQLANAHWREINGIMHSVTTYRESMETEQDFILRHMQAVKEMAKVQGEEARTTKEQRR